MVDKQPKKMRLLEEITSTKQTPQPAQQVPSKPSIDDLHSLIMNKLTQLESTHDTNTDTEKS